MIYRKLLVGDAAAYRQIRLEALKAHPENFGSSYEEQRKLPKLMFERVIEQAQADRFVIGVFQDDELIGICGFVPFVDSYFKGLENAGTLIQMYVRAGFRSRGIGLKLVEMLVADAFHLPEIEHVVLGVRDGNIPALRVYEKAGFLPYATIQSEDGDTSRGYKLMIISKKK